MARRDISPFLLVLVVVLVAFGGVMWAVGGASADGGRTYYIEMRDERGMCYLGQLNGGPALVVRFAPTQVECPPTREELDAR